MSRKTRETALETRSRILDAAEDVFSARGLARTSLADIAAAAGLTRGAIYWHFKDKSALFNDMCERVRLPLEALINADSAASVSDPMGQFLTTCVAVMHQMQHDARTRKVFDILLNKCEFVDPDDPILIRQRECFMQGKSQIKQVLINAVAQRQLPEDLDIGLAYVMVHATFSGLLYDWFFAPGNCDLAQRSEKLFVAMIHMLKTAPTLRLAAPVVVTDRASASG